MTGSLRRMLRQSALGIAFGTTALAAMVAGAPAANAQSCVEPALKAEQDHDLPPGLLLAMALVESGSQGEPYAYAMNVNGRAVYPRSADEATRQLVDRRGRLRAFATVGCVQLSVKHHRGKFDSVESMLDPWANTAYAAAYLRQHYDEQKSWAAAVQRYQGGTPAQRLEYQCKIHSVLQKLDPVSAEQLASSRCRGTTSKVVIAEHVQREFLENLDSLMAAR